MRLKKDLKNGLFSVNEVVLVDNFEDLEMFTEGFIYALDILEVFYTYDIIYNTEDD